MCEHRFCSQTKTRGDRNCTACFSLANIFNQSTNKSFGAKLQSEVTGGFTQVRIGNLINQSATSCAISIPPLLEDCSEQKTFTDLKNRNVLCVVKLIHTKTVQTKTRKHQNVQTVGGPMLPITEVVLHTRIKLLGNMWSKIKFLMPLL